MDEGTLRAMAEGTWNPAIRRLHESATYEELADHHERETKILLRTIRDLATELLTKHQKEG